MSLVLGVSGEGSEVMPVTTLGPERAAGSELESGPERAAESERMVGSERESGPEHAAGSECALAWEG